MNKETIIDMLKTYKWVLVAGTAALGLAGSFLLGNQSAQTQESEVALPLVSSTEPETSSSKMPEEKEVPETSGDIVIDVKGAVEQPGLYTLPISARVNDAIQAAGGLLDTADPKSVNLAQKLTDEAIVYVATKEEGLSVLATASPTPSGSPSSASSDLVNLNTATESDLQTISGIGAKRAADIIAYREDNGGFKSVDDLNNVSGIGDKTLESIRPYVTVD